MPFTLAHPAAVLPLRRLGLPLPALAAGAMAPDVPLFLGGALDYPTTHSPVGVLTTDVAVALVLLALWTYAVRDPLADLAPAPVRDRLAARVRPAARWWLRAVPAAGAGAATHVLWDEFTHAGRWGPQHVAWLREEHLGLLGVQWTQHTSSVVGLLVLTAAAAAWLRARPAETRAEPPVLPRATGPLLVTAAAAVGLAVLALGLDQGVRAAAFDAVIATGQLTAVAALATCLAWHVRRARGRVVAADR